MSLICCPISVYSPDSAGRDAHAAKAAGADLVEFRLDDFFHGDELQIGQIVALISDSPLPCIATCRVASEGGHYDGPEDARISLFERLGTAFGKDEHPPRYIDVEHPTYERSANIRQKVNLAIDHPEQVRDLQTSLILSTHDFQGRPADLTRRVLAMTKHPAAKVLKVAFLARSLRDNLEVFDLLAHRDRPMIALAMGEPGLMSRVLAPKFGGFLTFASLHRTTVTAPGQPTISELLNIYRFRAINRDTAVYGVVGSPVSHSLSPHIHNAGFESIAYNGVYLPLPIAPGYESLKATLLELIHHPSLTLRGLSITRPHKETIVRLAREQGWDLDETSAAIDAANTVSIERDDRGVVRIEVSNTDAPALVLSLTEAVGGLAGKRVAILGAGGVARATAHALSRHGARITVFNRTFPRAEVLAQTIPGAKAAALSEVSGHAFDIMINCTPLGMTDGPAPDALPVDPAVLGSLPPATVVVDTVYTPTRTPLLCAAHESGLRTLDGVSMFVNQAAAQFTNGLKARHQSASLSALSESTPSDPVGALAPEAQPDMTQFSLEPGLFNQGDQVGPSPVVRPFRRIAYPRHYAWVLALAILDILVTALVLYTGGTELNALARWAIDFAGVPGMVAIKATTLTIVLSICEYLGRHSPKAGLRIAEMALIANSAAVACGLIYLTQYSIVLLQWM